MPTLANTTNGGIKPRTLVNHHDKNNNNEEENYENQYETMRKDDHTDKNVVPLFLLWD